MSTELSAKANLYTQGFSEGVQQIREKLSQLNTALEENKQEMKSVNSEAEALRKEQKKLAAEMKDGGTYEQKKKMQELSDRLAQTTAKIGSLRAKEIELKSSVKSATKELDGQKTATKEVTNASDTAQKAVRGLSTAVKALVASAVAKSLWTTLIGSNAEMEQALTSFTVMLDDAQAAKELVEEMTDFAAHTPLELPDVTAAAKMLMNYGVAGDEVIEKLTQLGDLAGGNAVKLDRISLAYGQMLAKGKVTGEELRQMTEAGVPLLRALSDTIGVSTAEVQDMISKSKVGINDLDRAIGSLTADGGKFAGMMAQQSQTLTGMLSTAADTAAQFGRDVGDEAFEKAKGTLSEILAEVGKLEADGTLDEWADKLGDNFADVVQWGKNAIEVILSAAKPIAALTGFVLDNKEAVLAGIAVYKGYSVVQGIFEKVTGAVRGFIAAISAHPVLFAASVITGIVVALGNLSSSLKSTTEMVSEAVEKAKKLADEAGEAAEKAEGLSEIAQKYGEISSATEDSAEKTAALEELQRTLNQTYGETAAGIDLVNGKYDEQKEKISGLIAVMDSQARAKAIEAYRAMQDANAIEEAHVVDTTSGRKGIWGNSAMQQAVKAAVDTNPELFSNINYGSGDHIFEIAGTIEEKTEAYRVIVRALEKAGAHTMEDTQGYYTEMVGKLAEYEEKLKQNQIAQENYNRAMSDTTLALGDETEAAESSVTAIFRQAEAADKSAAAAATQKVSLDELNKSTENIIKNAEGLYAILGKVKNGEALTYDEIQRLIAVYPDLADSISVTADGYTVEKTALDGLNAALNDSIQIQLDAERKKTLAAIDGARERIKIHQREAEAIAKMGASADQKRLAEIAAEIGEEEKEIDRLAAKLKTDSSAGQYLQNGAKSSAAKSSGGTGNTSGGSGSDTDSEFAKERAELDYRYKMDEIAAEEYYKQLGDMRDKYLEKDSAEWRTVNIEIHNYQKKLAEDAEKDAEKAAKEAEKAAEKAAKAAEEAAKNAAENIKEYYSGVNKAFQEAADERIKIIDDELAAKKKASDEAIAAIDAEIEARKRANEDEDIQHEIDAVKAQLNYAQLDDFSRLQLERKLGNLYDEQAEMMWERGAADRKAAISSEYSAAEDAANAEKERISEAADHVEEALGRAADGISLCAGEIARAAGALGGIFGSVNAFTGTTINNYSNAGEKVFNTSVSFAQQPFTLSQIAQAVIDGIKGSPIF